MFFGEKKDFMAGMFSDCVTFAAALAKIGGTR